jgi:glycosyl transferase family 2
MALTQALRWLLLAVEIALAVPVAYLVVVTLAALLAARRRARMPHAAADPLAAADPACLPRIAVLVPAHDEELLIGRLLDSLARLTYPRARHAVYVVADNCSDRTAAIVRATGWANVYERHDTARRGKGYALQDLFSRLETAGSVYDAYVIVDADAVVDARYLDHLAAAILRGARALQGQNTVLNTLDAPSTVLRWLALTLMNHVRPLGRNGLGASATLTGNGMCLTRDLLRAHPWQAHGATEDYQYYLTLVQAGERVRYVPEAVVRSEMPATFAQMRTQDVRWESQAPEQRRAGAARALLAGALRHHDPVRFEALLELIAPPLSPLVASVLACAIAGALLRAPLAFAGGALLCAGVACYVGSALYLLRPPPAAYRALLHAPRFIAWKLWVLLALRRKHSRSGAWVRTTRAA